MPKKKGGKAVEVDENVLNDTILITNDIFESDKICRDVIEKCCDSAIEFVHKKLEDAIERKKASNDIMDGFIYFGAWCYMNKDVGEEDDDLKYWKQEIMPKRIMGDSWSSNIIPIRKIIQKKEEIFEIKSNSKTNSVRSGQSNRSKISRGSLRSKLRRSSMDLELKKPLKNIMDENSEDNELEKIEIIQLKNDENVNNNNNNKRNKKNRRRSSMTGSQKMGIIVTDNKNNKNNNNPLSININKNRESMNIGLKTGRLSMNSCNAYKYHPNKPYTFDHTGQKMSVIHIKPDKIPNNIVSPLVSFEDDNILNVDNNNNNNKDKKLKNKLSSKTRKKSTIKSKVKTKEEPIYKTNSVPVQPPIESIIKIENGVCLKIKNGTTIKGIEKKKKNKIENLSRSEYNQYIETLKNVTKTHVFDTFKKIKNNDNNKSNEETEEDIDDNNNHNKPTINTQQTQEINNSISNTLKNSSPKSHRSPLNQIGRMKQKSPKSIKYKRGLMSQQSDRMISEYNKNSLLPKIFNLDSNNDNNKNNKYQTNFITKNKKSKIEKSKLGKTLFAHFNASK